jgi:hypothetical protein
MGDGYIREGVIYGLFDLSEYLLYLHVNSVVNEKKYKHTVYITHIRCKVVCRDLKICLENDFH